MRYMFGCVAKVSQICPCSKYSYNFNKNRSLSMRLPFRKNRDKIVEKKPPIRKESNVQASGSNLMAVQEKAPPKMNLNDEYELIRCLAEGSFAQIFLVTHKHTKTTVALKAVHAELTNIRDFLLEYQYSYSLSGHPYILSTYDVAFQNDNCFFFAAEYAQYGDLSNYIKTGGLPESYCKTITQQIGSALEFLHSKQLVHRDIKLENVLVFEKDLSKVKLCDFGATRKQGSLVSKLRCVWMPFVPPELYVIIKNEKYTCQTANDVWQFAILIYFCLTGTAPWQHADYIKDTAYASFWRYQKRRVTKVPVHFKKFASRLLRMFRRMFEHKPENRSKITEVNKYLKDTWLVVQSPTTSSMKETPSPEPILADVNDNDDYEHNSRNYEQKLRMRRLLASYGLDTVVDSKYHSERVRMWAHNSNFKLVPEDLMKLPADQILFH